MAGPSDHYGAIMLVTYRIRPDADAAAYEDWLRRVDNPFFNASPLAERYVNWKIAGSSGVFAPNTYFDLWDMTDASRFGAIRGDAALNVFRAEWHRLWGLGGEGQDGLMQGLLCERVVAAVNARTGHLAVWPSADAAPQPGWQTWRVSSVFRGTLAGVPFLRTRFLADAQAAADTARRHPGAVLATVVAAPAH